MAQRGLTMLLAACSLAWLAGCASDPGVTLLDSGDSFCGQQYRAQREGPPTPAGLSRKERGRYEERTTDYHVSQGCQRDAVRSVTVPLRGSPGR